MFMCIYACADLSSFISYTCIFTHSLHLYRSISFIFVHHTLWHLVLGVHLHPQGRIVFREGGSVESGTARRSTSSTQERERLFWDIVARLSRAIEYLDSTLMTSTTLPNREKITTMRDELCRMIHTIESYNPYDYISIESFYTSLSRSVTSTMKYR